MKLYLRNGTEWAGETHPMGGGIRHTGATHSEDSVPVYTYGELGKRAQRVARSQWNYFNRWTFNGAMFTTLNIDGNVGFVYRIINTETNQEYIGKKLFYRGGGSSGPESNWKTYYGSGEALKADVRRFDKDVFERQILSLHRTRPELRAAEQEALAKQTGGYNMARGFRKSYNKYP